MSPGQTLRMKRSALTSVVEELEGICRRLTALHDSLPALPAETDLRDLDPDPDPAIEIRAVIQNVLANSLRPAIEDLRAAAVYRPGIEVPEVSDV